ncbi:MAG: flagellar hook-basal body complex protein FliE [Treponemataceae bacterium]
MNITGNFEMLRTNPAHIGSSPVQKLNRIGTDSVPKIKPITENFSNSNSEQKVSKPFNSYLVEAMNYVNNKQNANTAIAQRLITDPDSVNVEDVTTAMAEANLSLSMAQSIIDRLIKDWNEITSTR